MEFKKKDLVEIINTNGELIGNKDIPEIEPNADTQANGTTDQNAKIGTQPYRYDMLGRFGFTLMPFMEGEEKNEGQQELMNDLVDLMYEKYLDILKYYFKNPKRIKSDYRKHVTDGSSPEDTDKEWAAKIMKVVEKHFEESLKNLDEQFKENIAEGKVIEDKMVDKKEDEMATKSEDNEIKEKKLEKIAGLINKLEKKDIDKLINLLEKKNG
jgi:hypothetical protein